MSLWDVKAPRFKLEHLMALDVADASTLKSNVVHLLLQHPQGIKYGDFSGAFYKLHGHHPQLALHGYHSLTDLLTDMKNVVVLEKNSQATVVKIAYGAPLNHWLKERQGLDCLMDEETGAPPEGAAVEGSPDEAARPSESMLQREAHAEIKRKEGGNTCPPPSPSWDPELSIGGDRTTEESLKECPADGIVLIRDIIGKRLQGLKLRKLRKILNEKHGFDLEKFRISLGYKNTVSFLEGIPGLFLQKCQNRNHCGIRLQSGSWCFTEGPRSQEPDGFGLIRDIIGKRLQGLKLRKLRKILNEKHGFDLEKFRVSLGYKNTVSFLEGIPGLFLQKCQNRNHCGIRLQSAVLRGQDRTQEGRQDEEDSKRAEVQQQKVGDSPVLEEQPENIDAPRGQSLPDEVEDQESRPLTSRQVTNPSTSAKGFEDVCATIVGMEQRMIQTFNKFHTRMSRLEKRVAQNSGRLRILERNERERRSETAETLSCGQEDPDKNLP
ncbi:uncharacterized protein LOC129340682 [Eublepharis macularius]|uniref:Uncharacterized protein LOC129340682 n=1 Tax=Eublepharis macularius TaxID=481883 RepID=A0AA97K7K1_EUBMA|nr:uncharacterized protein LOC129340682 [Eublepharis macularius]XP_054851589.1 uncharacterized protein LOC129340682 [Eublepharis macularius]